MKKIAIVHHSDIEWNEYQFEKINKLHKKRWNWQTKSIFGFYVGYHFVIEKNWFVYQARWLGEVGAHCNENKDNIKNENWKIINPNYDTIWICLAGNFEKEEPTQEQIDSLVKLLKRLWVDRIYWHRDFKPTACPWNNLYKELWNINYLINFSYKNIYENEKENLKILKNKELAEEIARVNYEELFYLILILLGRIELSSKQNVS